MAERRGAFAATGNNTTESANSLARILLLAWAHFLNDGAATYLPGVLPVILIELHIPFKLVGTVMAAQICGQALQPLWGFIEDEVGGRWFVIAGVSGSALGGALIGVMPNYWSLVILLLTVSASSAMFHPQAAASIRMLPTARPGLFMSAFLLGGQIGLSLWPLLASVIVTGLGTHWLPLLIIPALFSIPFIISRVPVLPPRHPDLPRASLRRNLPALAKLVSFAGLEATAQYTLVTFMPILWVHRGGSLVGAASLITVMFSCGIVGNMIGGHLTDRIGHQTVMMLSGAVASVCVALLIFANGPIIWLLLGLIGMALFSSTPAQILLAQNILPENRSLGTGLALGFANGLGGLAMVFMGLLAAHWSISLVLGLSVILLAVATVMAYLVPRYPIHSATPA